MSVLRSSVSVAVAVAGLALISSCRDVPTSLDHSQQLAARRKPSQPPPPPPDTHVPTLPVFSVQQLGPTHVTLAWSSTDASTPILYRIENNGALVNYGFETSKTFAGLRASTTYAFRARARDAAGNWSEFSAPFAVTTTAPDPNDLTPPTTPGGVWAALDGGGTEMLVMWGASSDNVTPQSAIIYQIFVNDVLDNSAVGRTDSRVYGVAGDNVIRVIAIDAAGNQSGAGTFDIFIPF